MDCPNGSPDWVCDGINDLCFTCEDQRHRNRHPAGDVDGCESCRLQSLQLSPSCRGEARNRVAPAGMLNSWERGLALDHRGIPYRDFSTGNPIPIKRFADNRSRFEESIRANKALATRS